MRCHESALFHRKSPHHRVDYGMGIHSLQIILVYEGKFTAYTSLLKSPLDLADSYNIIIDLEPFSHKETNFITHNPNPHILSSYRAVSG